MAVMTYKEAYIQQKQSLSALKEENHRLRDQNEHLTFELERMQRQSRSLLERLHDSDSNPSKTMEAEISLLRSENKRLTQRSQNAESIMRHYRKRSDKAWQELEKIKATLLSVREENESLKREVQHYKALLNTDGSNSSLPTSKTPAGKKKVIPNSREKTNRKRGGQPGHTRSKLQKFSDDEISERIDHTEDTCPCCGGRGCATGHVIEKDEGDYEIIIRRKRHVYHEYRCDKCGKVYHSPIAPELKEENQYGSRFQALLLGMTNIGYVSINRTARMISGLTDGQLTPSEGYIAKLQKRASGKLASFINEMKKYVMDMKLLYWDDTVVFVNGNRGCMRFYGDEKVALYTAHRYKNREGIDEDGILPNLAEDTIVMHDHNTINYNEDFCFRNIECIQHLERDLQKLAELMQDDWPGELKELLKVVQRDRKQCIEAGLEKFDDEYLEDFEWKYKRIMIRARASRDRHYHHQEYWNEEKRMINRLDKYYENYTAWIRDFNLPITNNVSERALRGIKSKEKISGQFQSLEYAGYAADIKTYIETCYRNGVDYIEALVRLMEGNPYTLQELLT